MARLMLEREIWNNINHENFFHAASVLDEKNMNSSQANQRNIMMTSCIDILIRAKSPGH